MNKLLKRIRFGKPISVDGCYKLDMDELYNDVGNESFGITYISEKGIEFRIGKRHIILSRKELMCVYMMCVMLFKGINKKKDDEE